jgi:hypothetical protein
MVPLISIPFYFMKIIYELIAPNGQWYTYVPPGDNRVNTVIHGVPEHSATWQHSSVASSMTF